MTLRIGNITFDCDDALKLAQFWSAAIDRPVDPGGSPGFASIGGKDTGRSQPAWYFEKVPEGKAAKNRMHLDLLDPDPATIDRPVTLGAKVVAAHEMSGHKWTVMNDPEGNEFCVAAKAFVG